MIVRKNSLGRFAAVDARGDADTRYVPGGAGTVAGGGATRSAPPGSPPNYHPATGPATGPMPMPPMLVPAASIQASIDKSVGRVQAAVDDLGSKINAITSVVNAHGDSLDMVLRKIGKPNPDLADDVKDLARKLAEVMSVVNRQADAIDKFSSMIAAISSRAPSSATSYSPKYSPGPSFSPSQSEDAEIIDDSGPRDSGQDSVEEDF